MLGYSLVPTYTNPGPDYFLLTKAINVFVVIDKVGPDTVSFEWSVLPTELFNP